MIRKKLINIYDFSELSFKISRKDQAYFNTNLLAGRHRMQMRAFLLNYDWWVNQ